MKMKNILHILAKLVGTQFSLPKHHLKTHITEFSKTIGACSLVLDVGSGNRCPYRPLFDCNHYIGLDYFEQASITGDASYLPLPTAKVDVVLITEVLEHLPEPIKTLNEIYRVLRQDGYLILTVPLVIGVHDYVDYQRWTERGLIKLLTESNFEIISLKRRGGIFSTIGIIIPNIPRQIFGELREQTSWWSMGAYIISWVILTPIPWLIAPFDYFDKRQDYVFGYSVLCYKK